MKRKNYKEPTLTTVMLQHRCSLLSASDPTAVSANRSGYGTTDEETWGGDAAVKANPVNWNE